MHLFNVALCWIFFGFLAAHLARRREKNPRVWFWIGLTLGLLGVLLVYLIPNGMRKKRASAAISLAQPIQAQPQDSASVVAPVMVEEELWFYYDPKRMRHGPLSLAEMKKRAEQKELTEESFVWSKGMDTWKRVKELAEDQSNKLLGTTN